MKQLLIIFILLFSFSNSFAQVGASSDSEKKKSQRISEICGVEFGASFETAKEMLIKTFGEPVYEVKNSSIFYRDLNYNGVTFNTVYFMFDSDMGNSYMTSCMLYVNLDTEEEAKEVYKQLCDKISDKFTLSQCDNPDAEIVECFKGGVSPVDDSDGLSLVLGKYIKVGGYSYSILLSYGPYQYVKEGI